MEEQPRRKKVGEEGGAEASAAKLTPGSVFISVQTPKAFGSWYATALLTMPAALEFQRELAQAIEDAEALAANTTLAAKEKENGTM